MGATDDADCVIVGGGPAGAMLGYLLARAGCAVIVLESHADFARRFRGDTLGPATLDLLDELGLARRLLADTPHTRATAFCWHTAERDYVLSDFRDASADYGFFALLPQPEFLTFLIGEAAARPSFQVRMNARVNRLLHTGDRVTGVAYTDRTGREHELRARLVVAADGRSSKIRRLSGLATTELGVGSDLLWFDVPRDPATDPPRSGLDLYALPGRYVVALNQGQRWQLGYGIAAGSFAQARQDGVAPIREAVDRHMPWLRQRMAALTDVNQLTLLDVRITQVASWTVPGLLLIGDAAHVISPVGGNGINHALADAVQAANLLAGPLARGSRADVDAACLAVQHARKPITDAAQQEQSRIEARSRRALQCGDPRPPGVLRLLSRSPWLARWAGRRANRAVRTPHVSPDILAGKLG
ncbi:FAD-dependent oxidoreductase [Catellatospora sp. IY07-71]|uniref:FAD-dependent oxidoreductase n=1 Tax=Catellatospora sp. IY07-71 TaxID=2728827 RepID=UPI001BB35C85|nr:FAD-dependent oxidoreductase [Catellatospora sp. IY07-71]BCJ75781.1 FAD-dependent oxidoreductase [Catellatospora sp. IY07-71]